MALINSYNRAKHKFHIDSGPENLPDEDKQQKNTWES